MAKQKYPEHEKVAAVKKQSQTIGEFLDHGLAKIGLTLYERFTRDCECYGCKHSYWLDHDVWGSHTTAECEAAGDGPVQIEEWWPKRRTINQILADYFEIDLKKIEQEKKQMLEEMREANV